MVPARAAGEVQSSLNVEPAWAVTTGSPQHRRRGARHRRALRASGPAPVAAGGNLLPGYDLVSDAAVANDGDGRDADASDPGDWVTQAEIRSAAGRSSDARYPAENSSWHGTQVSGLIAALTDNGIGMASVGRNVRVLPVRVLGKCGGFDSDIIAGMRWAAGLSRARRAGQPEPGAGDQPEPRRRRRMQRRYQRRDRPRSPPRAR